jgi:hypothetical protein
MIKLIKNKKHPLVRIEALNYIRQIKEKCYELEKLKVRKKAVYLTHKKFGEYVYRYDKHNLIQWYIIYDLDKYENILIKKIISNNQTVK